MSRPSRVSGLPISAKTRHCVSQSDSCAPSVETAAAKLRRRFDPELALRFRGGEHQVEGVHAVRLLPPPVGADAAPDLDGRMPVPVGRVVIVPARVQPDRGAPRQCAEAGDVRGRGAGADHEEVDHPLGCPGLDVDPVEAAPRDVFGDSRGQQVRPAAAAPDFVQGGADLTHEAGQQVAVFPLLPLGEQHRDPGEVDGDAVVVVHRGDFPQDRELEVADPLAAEIPVHVPLVDEPVRVPCLQRDRAFEGGAGDRRGRRCRSR